METGKSVKDVIYGETSDRERLIADLESVKKKERRKFYERFKDHERSSMNNIMAAAEQSAVAFAT